MIDHQAGPQSRGFFFRQSADRVNAPTRRGSTGRGLAHAPVESVSRPSSAGVTVKVVSR